MRKLRIIEHISLDGVIQHSADDDDFPFGDWTAHYRTPAGRDAVVAAHGRRFDLLLGRRTYDIFARYWAKVENDSIADGLNAATKYVVTHRPDDLGWGPVEPLGEDIVEGVRSVRSQGGPDLIVWGSSTLTPVLLEEGLVDDVVLLVYPVIVGQGKRFRPGGRDGRRLTLTATTATPSGVLVNTYRPIGSLRSGS